MATQLKQTDFTPQAAPRPNIRVVFSAGPAALAMREKLAEVPGADRTLDELAAIDMTGTSPTMASLVAQSDEAEAAYNCYWQTVYEPVNVRYFAAKGTDAEPAIIAEREAINARYDELVSTCSDLQGRVAYHPVTTAADLRIKLAFMAKHQMGDGMDWTAELLADAGRIAARQAAASDITVPFVSSRYPADAAPPLTFDPNAPMRDLLDQRNAVAAWMNNNHTTEAEEWDFCSAINRIEWAIVSRTAATPEDAVAKLIAVVQVGAEGAEIGDAEAIRALVDARRHFGVGYVHDFMLEHVGEALPILSAAEVRWNAAWDAHETALAEDKPISARYKQARADGTMTDELEKEWDDSGTRMGDAEWALFETPAPNLAALMWKMKLIEPRGLAFDDNIAATFMADVARLGGVNLSGQGK